MAGGWDDDGDLDIEIPLAAAGKKHDLTEEETVQPESTIDHAIGNGGWEDELDDLKIKTPSPVKPMDAPLVKVSDFTFEKAYGSPKVERAPINHAGWNDEMDELRIKTPSPITSVTDGPSDLLSPAFKTQTASGWLADELVIDEVSLEAKGWSNDDDLELSIGGEEIKETVKESVDSIVNLVKILTKSGWLDDELGLDEPLDLDGKDEVLPEVSASDTGLSLTEEPVLESLVKPFVDDPLLAEVHETTIVSWIQDELSLSDASLEEQRHFDEVADLTAEIGEETQYDTIHEPRDPIVVENPLVDDPVLEEAKKVTAIGWLADEIAIPEAQLEERVHAERASEAADEEAGSSIDLLDKELEIDEFGIQELQSEEQSSDNNEEDKALPELAADPLPFHAANQYCRDLEEISASCEPVSEHVQIVLDSADLKLGDFSEAPAPEDTEYKDRIPETTYSEFEVQRIELEPHQTNDIGLFLPAMHTSIDSCWLDDELDLPDLPSMESVTNEVERNFEKCQPESFQSDSSCGVNAADGEILVADLNLATNEPDMSPKVCTADLRSMSSVACEEKPTVKASALESEVVDNQIPDPTIDEPGMSLASDYFGDFEQGAAIASIDPEPHIEDPIESEPWATKSMSLVESADEINNEFPSHSLYDDFPVTPNDGWAVDDFELTFSIKKRPEDQLHKETSDLPTADDFAQAPKDPLKSNSPKTQSGWDDDLDSEPDLPKEPELVSPTQWFSGFVKNIGIEVE